MLSPNLRYFRVHGTICTNTKEIPYRVTRALVEISKAEQFANDAMVDVSFEYEGQEVEHEGQEERILQMAVKIQWTVDNLRALGVGSMYHLAYRPNEVSYEVLVHVNTGEIRPGTKAEIVFIGGTHPVKIAEATIENIVTSKGFRRFDFRLQKLITYPEECATKSHIGILCRYIQPSTPTINGC